MPELIHCKECRHWNRPDNWTEWTSYDAEKNPVPWDWGNEFCDCNTLLDLKRAYTDEDQFRLNCYIDGDATSKHDIETRGSFGCILGDSQGLVVPKMEEEVQKLAAAHWVSESNFRIFWFPCGTEIRILEVDPVGFPGGDANPMYFGPNEKYTFGSSIQIIRPEEWGIAGLPLNWGKWEEGREILKESSK